MDRFHTSLVDVNYGYITGLYYQTLYIDILNVVIVTIHALIVTIHHVVIVVIHAVILTIHHIVIEKKKKENKKCLFKLKVFDITMSTYIS